MLGNGVHISAITCLSKRNALMELISLNYNIEETILNLISEVEGGGEKMLLCGLDIDFSTVLG